MRYRLMASYLGVCFEAGLGPDGTEATLFAADPPSAELGFAEAGGHWRKQVSVADLDAVWQARPVGDYRGEPCLVLDDLGDRLHIAYLGRDAARAAQLGYWEIDREVFEVVVARHDVINLVEERVDFLLAAGVFPSSDPGPPSQAGTEPQEDAEPQEATRGPRAHSAALAAAAGLAGKGDDVGDFWGRSELWGGSGTPGLPGSSPELEISPKDLPACPDKWDESGHPAGFGGTDRAARAPDRIAAWHGSPALEPWPASWPGSEAGTERAGPADRGTSADRGTPAEGELRTDRGTSADRGTPADRGSWPAGQSCAESGVAAPAGRRTGHKDRISPESVFAELLALSAIPQASYAVDEEVPGAMCLVKARDGFEVFSRTEDARLEVRFFEDEEAAYFYLFGVLAAEAVRSGRLTPGWRGANGRDNSSAVPGISPAATQNVSKYLRGRKLPKSPSGPARVYLAGGADGPPLPKQPRRPPEPQVRKSTARITKRLLCH